MKVYIKDGKTFRNKAIIEAFSYKLVKSIYTDLSELETEYDPDVMVNDIIYDNYGWYGLISEIERDGERLLQIKAEDIMNLFRRDIIYVASDMKTTTEQTMASAISKYFSNESDEVFQIPYLNVSAVTSTSRTSPSVESGVWNLKSYVAKVRRLQSVYADISFSASQMVIKIQQKQILPKKIFITNRNMEIIEESFSNTSISKITAYHTDPISSTDYYLLENGTITTTYQPTGRAEGTWEYLHIDGDQDEMEQVRNKFKENSFSHKISFLVPKTEAKWDFYDPVIIDVRNTFYNSYIAKKIILDDDTIEYQCGELRTTLSDKINYLN